MSIKLKPIQVRTFEFGIRSKTPMIQHSWSEKSTEMLRLSANERRKQPKAKRDPEHEAANCAYYTQDGEFGLPLLAFKSAIISAAHKDLGIEKTMVRKALFIPSTDPNRVVAMTCSTPFIREDIVRVGANQADLRYRYQFDEWSALFRVELDLELLNPEDLANLVNRAGFGVGIGEWRPEKGGEFGRFEIDLSVPMREVKPTMEEAA